MNCGDKVITSTLLQKNKIPQPDLKGGSGQNKIGGDVNTNSPLGIRNNNPGNIKLSNTKWEGMSSNQTDKKFVQFKSPEYGIRAMAKILTSYSKRFSPTETTIENIIKRWSKTDQKSYINHVSNEMQVSPDQPIVLSDKTTMKKLIQSIIHFENGGTGFYKDSVYNNALSMAGFKS